VVGLNLRIHTGHIKSSIQEWYPMCTTTGVENTPYVRREDAILRVSFIVNTTESYTNPNSLESGDRFNGGSLSTCSLDYLLVSLPSIATRMPSARNIWSGLLILQLSQLDRLLQSDIGTSQLGLLQQTCFASAALRVQNDGRGSGNKHTQRYEIRQRSPGMRPLPCKHSTADGTAQIGAPRH